MSGSVSAVHSVIILCKGGFSQALTVTLSLLKRYFLRQKMLTPALGRDDTRFGIDCDKVCLKIEIV